MIEVFTITHLNLLVSRLSNSELLPRLPVRIRLPKTSLSLSYQPQVNGILSSVFLMRNFLTRFNKLRLQSLFVTATSEKLNPLEIRALKVSIRHIRIGEIGIFQIRPPQIGSA